MIAPNARVVLLRHGETAWSRSGRHTSHTDLPLTEMGRARARAVGPALGKLGLRDPLVIASPLQRAVQTAELAGLPAQRTWDDLVEWNYGDYEGLTTEEIHKTAPHWTVWTHPCPHGESADAVQARADTVVQVAEAQLSDRDVVLFGHGHFSRALIARWIDLPVREGRRFAMAAAAFTLLGFEHGAHQVVQHNTTIGVQS
ncbi:MAG: acid phosphatase [Aldersonia sp.]|nr:acid phosphatase [Aldersonia sp.]